MKRKRKAESFAYLPVSGSHLALVPRALHRKLARHRWHRCAGGYVATTIDGRSVYLHVRVLELATGGDPRELLLPIRADVHHRNGDRLDNRLENLEVLTRAEHMQRCGPRRRRGGGRASSCFKGVLHRAGGARGWLAGIRVDGRSIHLGIYRRELEAAAVYDRAALAAWGERAFVNLGAELREKLLAEVGDREPRRRSSSGPPWWLKAALAGDAKR